MLFMSFILTPTLLVTCMDDNVDISMVFALVEEETKESKEKSVLDSDEVFHKTPFPALGLHENETKTPSSFFVMQLCHIYCPGEIAPPPELI